MKETVTDLTQKYLDGLLDDVQLRQLEDLLAQSHAAREIYAYEIRTYAEMRTAGHDFSVVEKAKNSGRMLRLAISFLAIAASLVLGVKFWDVDNVQSPDSPVVEIMRMSQEWGTPSMNEITVIDIMRKAKDWDKVVE